MYINLFHFISFSFNLCYCELVRRNAHHVRETIVSEQRKYADLHIVLYSTAVSINCADVFSNTYTGVIMTQTTFLFYNVALVGAMIANNSAQQTSFTCNH